jgi:3-oxoacyl-[acyl-carrier-protein] synthase-1
MNIAITGLGAVTSVGLSVEATCAALRAGISRVGELETYAVDGDLFDKKPVIGGRVPTEWFEGEPVSEKWPGHERFGVPPPAPRESFVSPGIERLAELAVPAALEAWLSYGLHLQRQSRIGLYVGLDYYEDPMPVVDALQQKLRVAMDPVVAMNKGRAAGLVALHAAVKDLKGGNIQGALVGGVDSLIRKPVLERLDEKGTLRSENAPQGVIPGEAAAFVFIETDGRAKSRGVKLLTRILSTGVGEEPTAGTEEPNRASGLTQILNQVRKDLGNMKTPPLVICDLNGDRYRAMEWAMASLRALGSLGGFNDIWHPAECIGDSGAASGLLNIVWAITALCKGYANAEHVLIWGASYGKDRAAAMLGPVLSEI